MHSIYPVHTTLKNITGASEQYTLTICIAYFLLSCGVGGVWRVLSVHVWCLHNCTPVVLHSSEDEQQGQSEEVKSTEDTGTSQGGGSVEPRSTSQGVGSAQAKATTAPAPAPAPTTGQW